MFGTGEIVAIVVGIAVLLLIVIVLLIVIIVCYRRQVIELMYSRDRQTVNYRMSMYHTIGKKSLYFVAVPIGRQ